MTVQKGQVSVDGAAAVPASVEVGEDAVSIVPEGAEAIALALVDITDLFDDDYTLRLSDYGGKRYDLSMLGTAYGQVVEEVRQRRDDRLQKELLLTGVKLADTYPGKLFAGPSGPPDSGAPSRRAAEPVPVEIRLFEDAIVVVPERAQMFGIPYSFVDGVDWNEELYQTTVRADDGQTLVFGHLAKRSEEFRDELQRLMGALAKRTADTLQGLLPGVSADAAGALAAVMRDGRAAQQEAIDALDPALWPLLETAVVGTDELRETYEALKAMTRAGQMALGVKSVKSVEAEPGEEPPHPEQGDNHLWFFAPVFEKGNAIAHEITSEAGHATYLYRAAKDEVAGALAKINRAILTLNFRREPIYASDEEIQTGKFSRYRVAVRSLDYLRFARERFLGRAIHNASWAAQIDEAVAKG